MTQGNNNGIRAAFDVTQITMCLCHDRLYSMAKQRGRASVNHLKHWRLLANGTKSRSCFHSRAVYEEKQLSMRLGSYHRTRWEIFLSLRKLWKPATRINVRVHPTSQSWKIGVCKQKKNRLTTLLILNGW